MSLLVCQEPLANEPGHSRDALILLAGWGLDLPVEEADELLLAADYRPLVLPAPCDKTP